MKFSEKKKLGSGRSRVRKTDQINLPNNCPDPFIVKNKDGSVCKSYIKNVVPRLDRCRQPPWSLMLISMLVMSPTLIELTSTAGRLERSVLQYKCSVCIHEYNTSDVDPDPHFGTPRGSGSESAKRMPIRIQKAIIAENLPISVA